MIEKTPQEIQAAFLKVSSTQAGQDALAWLMEYCGYKHSSLTMNKENQLLTDAVIHNEAKRAVWLDVRKLIPRDKLNLIEMEREPKACQPKKTKQ